jgi:hypothetical protein
MHEAYLATQARVESKISSQSCPTQPHNTSLQCVPFQATPTTVAQWCPFEAACCGVQVFSRSPAASRVAKILLSPSSDTLLEEQPDGQNGRPTDINIHTSILAERLISTP